VTTRVTARAHIGAGELRADGREDSPLECQKDGCRDAHRFGGCASH